MAKKVHLATLMPRRCWSVALLCELREMGVYSCVEGCVCVLVQRAKSMQDSEFIVGPNVATGGAAPEGPGSPLGRAILP